MKTLTKIILALALVLFTACSSDAQPTTKQTNGAGIQVIQFHSQHRCVTCLKIEKLTRSTLAASYPALSFTLYNVEDKKNEKIAEQFEATGTALFLYNPKTGKKKNLTEFAFMRAGNETVFDTELKKFIDEFIKG
jgi:hypothetical protein